MKYPFLEETLPIKWNELSAGDVEKDIKEALRRAAEQINRISGLSGEVVCYATTFAALENATETITRPWTLVGHLDSVMNSPELRQAYNTMLPEVTDFLVGIPFNADLWSVLRNAGESLLKQKYLHPHRRRYVEEVMLDFIEAGADLDETRKNRLAKVQSELSRQTQKYSENVLDATKAFELIVDDPAELKGLPKSTVEAARLSAVEKGYGTVEQPKYRFTLQITSMMPVMRYADSESLRKDLWQASVAKAAHGPYDNTPLIRDILRLRQERAELLGKDNFAEVVMARRMVRNSKNAVAFIENLHQRTVAAFKEENRELEQFKAEKNGTPGQKLDPWDHAYWAEKLRLDRYAFDEEEVRSFFPIDSVLNGLFKLTEILFGAAVVERTGTDKPQVWHPDVSYYDLIDSATGQLLGSFYADWYPRDDKRSGAWMNLLHTGERAADGTAQPHIGLMCGNMNPPLNGKPALLNHREVETVFHEFGHLLHHLLGKVEVKSLNGVAVAWDFVELPSQIMENWCWEPESLELFARHTETGEALPADLFSKMLAAKNFQIARFQMRQLGLGKMDLELHLNPELFQEGDIDALLAKMLEEYQIPTPQPAPTSVRSFTHIFGDPVGYACGYYSYKWAEVLDADAFTRFKAEGILNTQTGRDLRQQILEPGNTQPPEVLFRNFMGRDPDPLALLRRQGLVG